MLKFELELPETHYFVGVGINSVDNVLSTQCLTYKIVVNCCLCKDGVFQSYCDRSWTRHNKHSADKREMWREVSRSVDDHR